MNVSDNANLFEAFRSAWQSGPEKVLMYTANGEVFTYADAERESARLANALVGLGCVKGDRVTVQVEKSPQVLWLYLACLRAGLVYHPLNTAYQRQELAYFLDNARPRAVVCASPNLALFEQLGADAGVQSVVTLDLDGGGTLVEAASGCPSEFESVTCENDDLAALLYSSGTTGRPKGIMLSHKNLDSNARTLVDAWDFDDGDRLLHALPVFHVHGLFVAIHCVLLSAASMVWLDKFDVDQVIEALPRCTVMMGVPTYYTRLLAREDFTRNSCAHVRLFVSGSAPLLTETFDQFAERTGHRIVERYGMTETGMNTSNPLQGDRRPGTVGPPLAGVEVRVVDGEGNTLPAGEAGDLQVRGPNVFKGYWQMPEKTAEDFTEDGFFDTGDKGSVSTDGYVSIVGRAKDMIICGGLNVYPKEIEQLLDDITGVVETAVIGVPHPDFGEAVAAVIVAGEDVSLDEAGVIAFAKNQLANFKVPKRVFFVDALPRNAMGKVQKNLLREQYRAACA